MHVLALAALLAVGGVLERESARFEEVVQAEYERAAPGLAAEARSAGEAYRAPRFQEALERYERLAEAAPGVSHGWRRRCTALLALEDRARAIPLCRKALALARTPENRAALAHALVVRSKTALPTEPERSEAIGLARGLLDEREVDASTLGVVGQVALKGGEPDLVRRAAQALLARAPEELITRWLAVFSALFDEDWELARAQLQGARRLGLPAAQADALTKLIDDSEPAWHRYGPKALAGLGLWLAALFALVLLGSLLSALTLRSAARLAGAGPGDDASSRRMRAVYSAVVWLTCAAYYVSIPIVLATVLLLGGGAIVAMFAAGHVPIKLVVILAVVVLATGWAVLRSLWVTFLRPADGDPGERLAPEAQPRLFAALEEVATRLGTRRVDSVFVVPGTEVAVFERGGATRQLAGRSERCLILGLGVLEGMQQAQLKAILAHEYGHLINRDTAGGGLALSVRRSIREMAESLAKGGAATWYNPAWWFVLGFHRLFLRVSQGASRLQEILADRWAALAYGGRNLAAGLRHAIDRSVRFDGFTQASLREVIDGHRSLANLYRYAPAAPPDEAALAKAVQEAIEEPPSPYDSHPRAADRIAWAGAVEGIGDVAGGAAPAWDLFDDREGLEQRMTAAVRAAVAENHGVAIPARDEEIAQTG